MANQTLEELFEGLESVIGTMEQPEVSLEESFQLYHRGMELLKSCNDRLDKIEKKMLVLDDEGEMHEFEE
ncbi:MAG: exodeoxyribonuclease VII small subunit [Dorea sp.]|nr:exodeoxyribonuclease VII small subunit [Dorea sp.]